MVKHLEEFLDLSCDKLSFYPQQRAFPVGGNPSDLAARALAAFEQNIPVKQSEAKTVQTIYDMNTAILLVH